MLARFVHLVPFVVALISAANAHVLPHHAVLHARHAESGSSGARDPADYLLPGFQFASELGSFLDGGSSSSSSTSAEAATSTPSFRATSTTSSPASTSTSTMSSSTSSSNGDGNDLGSLLGGLIGSIPGTDHISDPDVSRYEQADPEPRWGASAAFLNGLQAIVFSGGQMGEKGHITNETLLLDMSGLTNLQSIRAAVNATPWLKHHNNHLGAPAPSTAYAASRVSTSVCGATDGHAVDTLWLAGGKTEDCSSQSMLYTYSMERKNDTIVGVWHDISSNGTMPRRRAHAQAAFTGFNFAGGDDVSMIVLGGQDWDEACRRNHKGHTKYAFSLDQWIIGNVMDQQCEMPRHTKRVGIQTYAYRDTLDTVPVIDYAGVSMPAIENAQTKHTEEPFLLLGGRSKDHKLVDLHRPWAIDLASGNWSRWITTGDIPSPRVGHSAVHAMDGKVYVYGGYKKHGTKHNAVSKVPTDEMYVLDASSTPAVWSKVNYQDPPENGPLPSKRAYHSAVMVDDVMVVAFGQQHKGTAYGLEKRGGTNQNSSEPLVMYMETRNNIMGFRWTDKLSAIVSARITENLLGVQTKTQNAKYLSTSSDENQKTKSKPSSMPLPDMSRVPTPIERHSSIVSVQSKSHASAMSASSVSSVSASRASVSRASVSRASVSRASASQASVSRAKAEASRTAAANKGSNQAQGHGQQQGQEPAQGQAPGQAQGQGQDQGQAKNGGGNGDKSSDGNSDSSEQADKNGDNKKENQSTTSSGAIAGGVLGACALAVGAVVGGLYAYRKRRESQKIAELRSNGVLYNSRAGDPESAPPVSSLWLQRPLKEVIQPGGGLCDSNMSAASMQGHVGTPLSASSAGGRSIGSDERHEVRGPRSAYATGAGAMPDYTGAGVPGSTYSAMPQEHGIFDDYMAAYAPEDQAPSQDPHYSYPYFGGGIQRSSGGEVTTNVPDDLESVYTNTVDGKTMVHGDDNEEGLSDLGMNGMRRSASFRFPEAQSRPYTPHDNSMLRVMNHP